MIIGLQENIYWKLRFELFDFELTRVRPRPLNVAGHFKSEINLSFESQNKNFYWHFLAISFRLRYIFTSKYSGFDLAVWPFEVTCQRSKIFVSIESSIDFFLYLVQILRYYFTSKFFQGLTLTFDLWRTPEVSHFSVIRNPIHDFLYTFYWHYLYISYRFWDIWIIKSRD